MTFKKLLTQQTEKVNATSKIVIQSKMRQDKEVVCSPVN